MNGRVMLIAMLLPFLAGCQSYTPLVRYANTSIADTKQGQDCKYLLLGLGGMADVTGAEAMRLGGITRLRHTEYHVKALQGVGSECMIAHGE